MTKDSLNNQDMISVIITTYNWPEALALTLEGFQVQEDQNFEAIIVDDGSKEDTKSMIKAFKQKAAFPITHLWQKDKGFRAARARNLGIQKAKGKYLIFIDGDCIPQTSFIKRHRQLAESRYLVVGHRVILNQKFTQEILEKKLPIWFKGNLYWFFKRLGKSCNKFLPCLYFTRTNRYRRQQKWQGAKTCNLAAWKKDLMSVFGFDENFEGWGYEDSDLTIRLFNNGIKRKSGKFATEVFHLWHKQTARNQAKQNSIRLEQILTNGEIKAQKSLLKQVQKS